MQCSQTREVVFQSRYEGSAVARETLLTLRNFTYCPSDKRGNHLGDLLVPPCALVVVFALRGFGSACE